MLVLVLGPNVNSPFNFVLNLYCYCAVEYHLPGLEAAIFRPKHFRTIYGDFWEINNHEALRLFLFYSALKAAMLDLISNEGGHQLP